MIKTETNLKYRRAKKVPIQSNSERCLVLRQQYSTRMLEFLKSGKRVINIDETWLNETNFVRKMWCDVDNNQSISLKSINPSLSMIAALDNEGRIYFSLSHASTD